MIAGLCSKLHITAAVRFLFVASVDSSSSPLLLGLPLSMWRPRAHPLGWRQAAGATRRPHDANGGQQTDP